MTIPHSRSSSPASSLLDAEVTHMREMMGKPVAALAQSKVSTSAMCWHCGGPEHLHQECPKMRREVNSHGSQIFLLTRSHE